LKETAYQDVKERSNLMGNSVASEIMTEYAALSGLSPAVASPQRYLWTDAFAVCNFLGLYRQTGDEEYRQLALLLVDKVHTTLGRHRADDSRTGWISGLDEKVGASHPSIGGLRIGKEMNERRPGDPIDTHLEWDRDGQYYHYLTQWMHALSCVSRTTGDPEFNRWAAELAKTAHAKFTYIRPREKEKFMYWKKSIDLSYPLVCSMGHHDPLDGLITYSEVQSTAKKYSEKSSSQDLSPEIADMSEICDGKSWTTDDPLGIGGLLSGAYRIAQLIVGDSFIRPDLLDAILGDALKGLNYFAGQSSLNHPAETRLAFRELGLSIGLQAIGRLQLLLEQYPDVSKKRTLIYSSIRSLGKYAHLSEQINAFWLESRNRKYGSWKDHRNINMVMLASSLSPDGYLSPL
jgi:hypothetical protein